MTACADLSIPANVLCIDPTFFLHFFLLLVIIAIMGIYSVCYFLQ